MVRVVVDDRNVVCYVQHVQKTRRAREIFELIRPASMGLARPVLSSIFDISVLNVCIINIDSFRSFCLFPFVAL